MQNSKNACPDLTDLLQEWNSADQPLLDPRPEAIECYMERKAEARSALRNHRLTCAQCTITKPEHNKAEIFTRLTSLVRPAKAGGPALHNLGPNGHRHGSRA